ncbi:tRNA (5-methylaminomethyl-2-thiouridine)(34)-methyltransferase MnmD [Chryseobacterium sp. MP_3.2]|uniref:tRNA (5-methylaminomethyl-2-thiouridine)(34)-methyltransferase MnmD n=1 Tax=Chryseobacterium sp. MP_3.2 TaxID=3071712 RepID=UPI002E070710|nr:tRNA U34 5-methylaminomethyl-2-thiouridine-forming methyltransferase MnmC [Chryseobacterium sp. MP_3.2]
MQREIRTTSDGSKTLFIKDLNENYHSQHGAVQEAVHVFIDNGFKLIYDCEINILELGFGTGLNVLVTINEYLKTDKNHIVNFFTVEKYPITSKEIEELNHSKFINFPNSNEIYTKIHHCEWGKRVEILPNFYLTKYEADFFDLENIEIFPINLVYFDCFGARVQPDLWEHSLMEIVNSKMQKGGLLTTYSSKGSFRRVLQNLNFLVEKKQGPPGKREMINATKQ